MALPDKPDSDMVKKILGEINMNEQDLDGAVITMKQWLAKRPHLPKAASDDAILKAFIIGCKSVERAKVKLDNYFTYRLTYKDYLYVNRDPMLIEWEKASGEILILPGLTSEGYKVCIVLTPDKNKLPAFELEELAKIFFMMLDLCFRDHFMSPNIIFLFDMMHLSVELIMKFSIGIMSASSAVVESGCPIRVKGLICFNAPSLTQTFFSTFVTPFLSSKVKQRVHFHCENHRCLDKYLPLEILPSDYEGGKNPSIQTLWSNIRKNLESERDWFLNEGSQTVNEDLRPKDDSDEMKGTFRKLQID